jgi:hypothetical protein
MSFSTVFASALCFRKQHCPRITTFDRAILVLVLVYWNCLSFSSGQKGRFQPQSFETGKKLLFQWPKKFPNFVSIQGFTVTSVQKTGENRWNHMKLKKVLNAVGKTSGIWYPRDQKYTHG